MRIKNLVLTAILTLAAYPAFAAGITFERPSAIATPGKPSTGVGVYINNDGPDDKIVSASVPDGSALLMTSEINDKGMLLGKPATAIPVPGGKTTVLNIMGDYINIVGIKKIPAVGEKMPLMLTFEKAGKKTLDVDMVAMEEFGKRFPPEVMGPNLEKMREVMEAKPSEGKNWATRLRDKIRTLGRREAGLPSDIPAPVPAPMPIPSGPMSTPDNPLPPNVIVTPGKPAVSVEPAAPTTTITKEPEKK